VHWTEDIFAASRRPAGCPGSQREEDEILAGLLPDSPIVYVDVGAAAPVECSNTWQFYLAGGHGLLIEPLAQHWPALLRQRHRDRLWPMAAGAEHGEATLREFGSGSSLLPDWEIVETGTSRVEVMPLAEILNLFPTIRDKCQFLDVDVEGFERQVFEGIDWRTFHPRVICAEWIWFHPPNFDGRDVSLEWAPILTTQGYREVARTEHNAIYAL